MKSVVVTETMQRDGEEFILACVSNSDGTIGLCDTSRNAKTAIWETFYMDGQALINIVQQCVNNNYSNKLIWQASSKEKCSEQLRTVLTAAADNYFLYEQNLQRSISPVLELLSDGLYVIHTAKMIPTDGAGNFFWNAYLVKHEFTGSGTLSASIPPEKNFKPCFLIPTESPAAYNESRTRIQSEKIHTDNKVGGIAYHVSGMFCALLEGHHVATAAVMDGADFNCIVIEPIRSLLFENEDKAKAAGRSPKAIALSTPFVKIPVGTVPKNMLEMFLMSRKSLRPQNYLQIRASSDKLIRYKNQRIIPKLVYENVDKLPDCEMVESASVIDKITDEQLDALLQGETTLENKVIINQNYYSSVVTACNFLQFTDRKRFIEFAVNILYNTELTAVHMYVANRVNSIMNPRLNEVFSEILDSTDSAYNPIRPMAMEYVKQYKAYTEQKLADSLDIKPASFSAGIPSSFTDAIPGDSDMVSKINKAKEEVNSKIFSLNT